MKYVEITIGDILYKGEVTSEDDDGRWTVRVTSSVQYGSETHYLPNKAPSIKIDMWYED